MFVVAASLKLTVPRALQHDIRAVHTASSFTCDRFAVWGEGFGAVLVENQTEANMDSEMDITVQLRFSEPLSILGLLRDHYGWTYGFFGLWVV